MGLGLGAMLGGCFGAVAYPCTEDAQCQLDGREGFCEQEQGYCSLSDDGCVSGRRFTEHAPTELAERCVGEQSSSSSSSSSDGSEDSDSTGPICEGEGCGCVDALLVRGDRTCVTAQGRLHCWGDNEHGVVSPGGDAIIRSPAEIELDAGLGPALQLAMSDEHACARTADGIVCWGRNDQGQVDAVFPGGMGSNSTLGLTLLNETDFQGTRAVAVGSGWSCVLGPDGTALTCWGRTTTFPDMSDGAAWPIPLTQPADGLAMTLSSVCARGVGGAVECLGSNAKGLLGDTSVGSTSQQPQTVPTLGVVEHLVASAEHYCAATAQEVHCWGSNDEGETGWPTDAEQSEREPSTLGVAAESLALSSDTSCALSEQGVSCWGLPPALGSVTTSAMPTAQNFDQLVEGSIVALGIGTSHACALIDSRVWCWGDNSQGQLGVSGADGTEAVLAVSCPG